MMHPGRRVRVTLGGESHTGTLLQRVKVSSQFDWYVEIDGGKTPIPYYEYEIEVLDD